MYKIVDSKYGADADGNRGVPMVFYELEAEDTEEIKSQIIEFIQSTGELPENPFVAILIDPVTEEDVQFEVNPFLCIPKDKCKTYRTTKE